MADDKSVMILGSGRLADRLTQMFAGRGVETIHVDSEEFREDKKETEVEESSMDYACDQLVKRGIRNVSDVCVVDKKDEVNIYLLMAVLAVCQDVRIHVALFNDSLVVDLTKRHRNVKVFNPAAIVSKLFVEAIPASLPKGVETKNLNTYNDYPGDWLIFKVVFGFLVLVTFAASFFVITESVEWKKGFYLVTTIITSVNFNDAELMNYDPTVQVVRMLLMLMIYGYVCIFVFGFIVDKILKRRMDIFMLGRKKYNKKNHVIVCGLGRVGYAIVQKLAEKGEDVLVVESDMENKYLPAVRASKVPVLIGDATLPHYLIDAGVCRAKALISAIDLDKTNLEIGRHARAENPNIRLLLRIFDQKMADEMKKRFNIHYAFSKSFASAKTICDWVCCYRRCAEINKSRVCKVANA